MKALVSSLLPSAALESLRRLCDVFLLTPDGQLASPVRTHPDMLVSLIGRTAIIPAGYAEKNSALCGFLENAGYEVILSHAARGENYPNDVGLNCAVGDRFIICRAASADPNVLCAAEKSGYDVIDVKQGYAGCSCIVCGSTVITSDRGIYKSVRDIGIDTLLVQNDGIVLHGYNVGFIGGCGGYCDGVLYFTGDIGTVPAGNPIRNFAREHGYEIVCLSGGCLSDFGGIKFL